MSSETSPPIEGRSVLAMVRQWGALLFGRARQPRSTLDWAYLALWLFYLCSYPIAVTGVAFDVRPGFSMLWAGSILLLVQGVLAVLALLRERGVWHGALLACAVALGGYAGEALGVATGWPFGPYRYATILFPQLPGSVPLPVVCAWLLVVIASVAVARWCLPRGTRPQVVALAALWGAGLDLVLEPVAVHVQGYWVWLASGPYYDIPTANFIGWAALCALLAGVLVYMGNRAGRDTESTEFHGEDGLRIHEEDVGLQESIHLLRGYYDRHDADLRRFSLSTMDFRVLVASVPPMVWLYGLTAVMFGVVDLTHGLLFAALIDVGLITVLAVHWRATYHIQ